MISHREAPCILAKGRSRQRGKMGSCGSVFAQRFDHEANGKRLSGKLAFDKSNAYECEKTGSFSPLCSNASGMKVPAKRVRHSLLR